MGRPSLSVALKSGDKWSSRWPGKIELRNGLVRQPYVRKNGRCSNKYFIETVCTYCGIKTLQWKKHHNGGHNPFCSKRCKSAFIRSQNQGKRSIKEGENGHYILIRVADHPRAVNGKVLEHLLIIEKKIGRPVSRKECVHHIDLVKSNNDPTNLHLCKDQTAHHNIHRSLNECIAELLDFGVLSFNRRTHKYEVRR